MNIWYFNHYAGGPCFGKYLRSYHLAQHWLELGHRCTIFLAQYHHLLQEPLPKHINADGVDYVSLPARTYRGNGLGRLLNMVDFCRAMPKLKGKTSEFGKPDAIILSSAPPFGIFPAASLAKHFGSKLVFEVRDLWPLSITEIAGKSSLHPLAISSAIAERFAYRNADLCASLLGNSEQYMRARGLRGSFVHVPNGYEPLYPEHPTTAAGRAALDRILEWQSDGRTVIIHPGAQGVPNALDVLINACRLLAATDTAKKMAVLLLGEGSETQRLKSMASDLPFIEFAPNVPKDEALYLTQMSDIGYAGAKDHRNVYQYGISFNKIADFMGAGLPVIVPFFTRGDAVSESRCGIVTDSDSPEVVADAIISLVDLTKDERKQMGLRGKQFVESNLSYQVIARRYAEAIKSA